MKVSVFIKIIIGVFFLMLCAKLFGHGLTAPNSAAAEFYFSTAFGSLIISFYCFLGHLFE